MNQTRQLHAISRELPRFRSAFTPFYVDSPIRELQRAGLTEFTIFGKEMQRKCISYLSKNQLPIDFEGHSGKYDLVVTCCDLAVQRNVRGLPLVLVQEGMVDPETFLSRVSRRTGLLPKWVAGTALMGTSPFCSRVCVASEGYRHQFIERGTAPEKLRVTGIPCFDDCARYLDSDLPYRGYALACTSDLRETFRRDDRQRFLERVRALAAGRPIRVKLHPNENAVRARREIARVIPDAIVHQADVSAEHLIANCSVLVAQVSSVVFVAMALGKPVYSHFEPAQLERLLPIQNGGRSARRIAEICTELLGVSRAEKPKARLKQCAWTTQEGRA